MTEDMHGRAPARAASHTMRRARRAALTVAALALGASATSGAALAAPLGALDATFGGGVVELPPGTQLNGAAVQRDGRLVVTGSTGGASDPQLLVARFNPSGGLDPTFSGDGMATGPLPSGATKATGEAVAIEPDGRIVVAGDVRRQTGADGMLVAVLNPDGGFSSFGSGGVAAVLRGSDSRAEANAVAVRGSEIIVGGAAAHGGGAATGAVARIDASGNLIGTAYLDIGESTIEGLALQPDGKIAVAGSKKSGQSVQTFIGRTNPDGSKDATFAGDGVLERQLATTSSRSALQAIAVQPDGKLVAAGYALAIGDPGLFNVITRVNPDGSPDGSFGGSAGVRYVKGSSGDVDSGAVTGATGLVLDSGHVYTGGSWEQDAFSALAVQAQNASGDLDGGFSGGQTITPVHGYAVPGYGMALALSPDGLYLVGSSGNLDNDSTTGVVARYGAYPFAFPALPGAGAPGGGVPGGVPGGGVAPPAPPVAEDELPPSPAKLEIARAQVLRAHRRLNVLAPITALASGEVKVAFQAAGRTERFKSKIDSKHRRIRFNKRIPKSQARMGTGIMRITYDGDEDTQPQEVRLRAAAGKAKLDATRPKIKNGRLTAKGEISRRARGVVRLQLLYEPPGEKTRTLQYTARIKDGKYKFNEKLSSDVRKEIAARRGVVHSYTLFTGYLPRRIRGEMTSYQVLPAP